MNEPETQILHPGSRKLFAHWEMIRGEQACPAREEFAFGPIKELLPDMVLIERGASGNGYRFRLAGSNVCALFGRNLTASDVLLGWDAFEASILASHFDMAFTDGQPLLARMRLVTDTGLTLAAELVAMPIQARNSRQIQLIGGLFSFRELKNSNHRSIHARELLSARAVWTEHEGPAIQALIDRALAAPGLRPTGRPLLKILDGGKSAN